MARATPTSPRRRAFLVALPLATVAVVLTYIVELQRPSPDPFNLFALPLLALLFSSLAALHLLSLLGQRPIEQAFFAVTALAFFGKFGFTLLGPYAGDRLAHELSQVYIWTPFIYALAFLVGARHGSLWRAGFVYLLSLSLGLLGVALNPGAGSLRLVEYYLSNAVLLSLLYLVGSLRTRLGTLQSDLSTMERLATEDFLTGVPNRRHLEGQLRPLLEGHRRYGTPVSVILFDIDNFKRFNDTHGHDLGDEVLRRVARAVHDELRISDAFGRWGGEEFLVVAAHTDAHHATLLAERLRSLLAGLEVARGVAVTASFGVAASRNDASPEALLARADAALYEAKRRGKDRVELERPLGVPETLNLPELRYPFPEALRTPEASVVAAVGGWLARFELGPAPSALRQRVAGSFSTLALTLHPAAPPEWQVALGKWYCWAFVHDDRCDATELGRQPERLRELTARLLELFSGASAQRRDEPLAHALADLRGDLLALGGAAWLERATQALEQHFAAFHWEACNRASGTVPPLGRYLEMRPVTAGLLLEDLFSVADGVALNSLQRSNGEIVALVRHANEVVCWANDLRSLDKELQQGDVHNLVRVLQHAADLGLQQAVDQAEARHAQALGRYLEHERKVRAAFRHWPDLEAYLRLLRARMRGIHDWGLASGRYR